MEVVLYALSTCGWCRRTKKMLDEAGVEYRALDVDLLEGEEKEQARAQVACHNPRRSSPTLVVDGEKVVIGYNEQRLREVLGI